MRLYRASLTSLVTCATVLISSAAFAQEVTTTAEASAPTAPAPTAEAAPAPAAPAEEKPGLGFAYQFFGDAYANYQTAQPGTAAPSYRAYDSANYVSGQGMQNSDGFSLAFAGVDLAYASKSFGATTSFRFGPGVTKYYAVDPVLGGLGAITQAYVTWKPTEALTLDLGQFGTIFGAEVAESWLNLNYTRGALYYQLQPFWHTGLRATYQLTPELAVKLLVVNEQNSINLGTGSVNLAGQVAYTSGNFGLAAGAMFATDTAADAYFDRFFDLVATYGAGPFKLVFNGDLVQEKGVQANGDDLTQYGASLAAGYAFTDSFGVALRGEFLDLDASSSDNEIITGTLTLDTKPVPGTDLLVLRWDNRIETNTGAGAYFNRSGQAADAWFTSTVGLVVHTNGVF